MSRTPDTSQENEILVHPVTDSWGEGANRTRQEINAGVGGPPQLSISYHLDNSL